MLLALSACGGDSSEGGGSSATAAESGDAEANLTLSAEEQQKLGIEVATLMSASFTTRIEGPARILDPQAIVGAMAELGRAEAAAQASASALKRARDLYKIDTAVSAETLEGAERQAAADQAQLSIARSQATLGFGTGAPWLDAARRDAMLTALSTGKALVVSATFTSGLDGHVPSELTVQRVGSPPDAKSWKARQTWVAPADPAVPGLTFLGWVGEPDGLVAGDRLTASVAIGETLSGIVVPGSAVVIAGGDSWAYLRMADGAFIRTRIALSRPTPGGYFQTQGFEAGQTIVVAGAGLLLARETGGGVGEED